MPSPMPNVSPAVDAYIDRAQPFAQPILQHLRALVWRAVPDVEEQIKWSRPFFLYRGIMLANMSAFKAHCSFGLWGADMAAILQKDGIGSSDGMGTFGRILSVDDLPKAAQMESYVRQAAALIGTGERTRNWQRVAKPSRPAPAAIPAALATAFETNPAAKAAFARLSPSCRREYVQWIDGAKREETRARRVLSAVGTIAEGKGLNWRYETPRTASASGKAGEQPGSKAGNESGAGS